MTIRTTPKDAPDGPKDLRRRAQERVKSRTAGLNKKPSSKEARNLLQELQIHQVELEMQNEEIRRTQAELETALTRYTDLYDFAPVAYLTLDERGWILEANLTAARLLGTERSRLLQQPLAPFIRPEDIKQFWAYLVAVVQGQAPPPLELNLQGSPGADPTVQLDSLLVQDAAGHPQVRASLVDITARKQAEETLRAAVAKWRTTFDAIGDAVCLLDSECKILQCNLAMADLVGKPFSEIIGSTCWEVMHGTAGPIDGCPLVRMKQSRQRETMILPLGDRRLNVMVDPVLDEAGEVAGAVHLIADITKIKRTEETLRQTHDYLANLINYANAPIIVWDPEFRITRFNHAFEHLTGYSTDEVLGQKLDLLFPEASRKKSLSKIVRTLSGEHWQSVEIPILRKDGEVRIALWNSANIYAEDGTTLLTTIAQGQDITERKEVEKALRESEDRYRSIFESTSAATSIVEEDTTLAMVNTEFERLTGYSKEEIEGKLSWTIMVAKEELERIKGYHYLRRRDPNAAPIRYEFKLIDKQGKVKDCLMTVGMIPGSKRSVASIIDIGDRKQAEEALQVSHRFLEIANRHNEMAPLLQEFVEEVQKTVQCQAVAIRVLDADANIPYQAYEGFSREFYELESPLSIKRDECMCINVIKGTTDPQLPFYTPGGSFYMNATTRFLATVSEEEKGRTRNACNEFGYESVALVPIRLGDHILGLIHMADPQENMIPLERVEQLEGIAQQLGAAMQRVSSIVALAKLYRQYELILTSAWEGIMGLDLNGNHTFVNPAAAKMLGYEPGELLGRHSHSTWHHTRPNGSPYPAEECPIYKAFRKGSIQHVTDEQFWRKDGTSFAVEAISTPIKENGDISGSVVTFWDITQRKQAEESLKNSMERLQRTMEGTVKALSATVETRDPYTAGHQQRVAQLAGAISQAMGFSQEQLEGMQVLGLLHDIGKVAVPAEILSKPGKISEMEFNLIKAHPQVGHDILKDAEFPWPIAQAVLQHHERMDGSGYPQGLTGPDITLCARILAVADVVEAMSSHRPYRPALGIDQALEEISRNRGTLYDPLVVDACVKLFREQGYELL